MVIVQSRPKRKSSGGRYTGYRSKRMHEMGRLPTLTKIDQRRAKTIRTRGGNQKYRVLQSDMANLLDPKSKKYSKAKIMRVLENPANRHYARRNIITKGTVIKTDKGDAKVTSRPGQDGTVNAVLISK
jgi:small subunit ribosomal protein S8e